MDEHYKYYLKKQEEINIYLDNMFLNVAIILNIIILILSIILYYRLF